MLKIKKYVYVWEVINITLVDIITRGGHNIVRNMYQATTFVKIL